MALLKSTGHQQIAKYIDPLITILFVIFLAPPLVKQMVYAIKDLLDAAPPQEVQDRLERIVEGYAEKYGFRDYLIYSSKRGRTVTAMIHIILSEDLPVSRLDGIRKQILLTYIPHGSGVIQTSYSRSTRAGWNMQLHLHLRKGL